MRAESLDTLRRLRQRVVDEAGRDLAECLAKETAATIAVRRQADEIERQRKAVEHAGANDLDVEAFGAWLRQARVRLGELSGDYERLAVETTRSRAALATARSALEAIETLVKEAETAAAVAVLGAEQKELDEITAREWTNRTR